MSGWRETTLGDVLTLQRGFDITKKEQRPGTVPVVSSSGINSYHDEPRVAAPGVVIGRKGSLGTVFFMREPFWPHDTTLWVKEFRGNDPYYCHLLLRSLPLAELDGGAANPTLNRNHAHSLRVQIPDPATQRRIAGLIGAFGELIAISERRIEMLEDLARSLYREWFVRFRFPGAPNGGDGDEARPENWHVVQLGDVSENLDRMRRPLSKAVRAQRAGPYPYYGAAKLLDFVDGWIYEGEHLLFAEDGTVATHEGFPVLQLVDGQFWANNHTHVLRGTAVSTRYLYLATAGYPIAGHITGAAQPKITQENLKRVPIVRAPGEVHRAFDRAVDPLFDSLALARRTTSLATTLRDLLLPRLITGRLELDDVDLGNLLPPEEA